MPTEIVITLAGDGNVVVGEVDYLPPQGDTGPQGFTGPTGPPGLPVINMSVTRDVDDRIDTVTLTFSDGSTDTYTVGRDGAGKLVSLTLL